MSNRFHNKFHRENHHSAPSVNRPDSSFDPIASYDAPFKGEFYSVGEIITTEYLSAGKLVYDENFNSGQWNSAYTTVQTNSGSWNSTFTTVETNSANWGVSFDGRYLDPASTIKISTLYVRGTGLERNSNRLIQLNGDELINAGGRGLHLLGLDKDLNVVFSNEFDVYGSVAASDSLAEALTGIQPLSSAEIGILTSYDAIKVSTTKLRTVAASLGLSKLANWGDLLSDSGGIPNSNSRSPYAAVFSTRKASNYNLAYSKDAIEKFETGTANSPNATISTHLITDGTNVAIEGSTSTNALYSSNPNVNYPIISVNASNNVKIGVDAPDKANVNVTGSYLQTANVSGHYVIRIQDGTGRVNHYWNTLGGPAPTFDKSNEGARRMLFGGFDQPIFQLAASHPFDDSRNSAAGDPITWRSVFTVDASGSVGIGTSNPSKLLDVNGDGIINGDLTVFGKLSTLGELSYLDTILTTTSAISVVNVGGPVPALTVSQTGPSPVATFIDDGQVAMFISGDPATPGFVGIGTDQPATSFHIDSTDALVLPVGGDADRVNEQGAIRFNSDQNTFEGFDGADWGPIGGEGGVSDTDGDTYIDAENPDGADNDTLQFFTAGTERVRINSSGLIMQNGAITPTAGSGETDGIMFPKDPFGGGFDTAFIRYQQDAGENTAFVFGTTNDNQDRLTLQQRGVDLVNLAYGRVGINRIPNAATNEMLSVNGNVNIIDTANAANSVTFTGQTRTAGAADVITASNDFLQVTVNGVTRYIRLFDIP